jgi:hypothetical protein
MKACAFRLAPAGQTRRAPRQLSQLKQHAIEDAHQHFAGTRALGLGHVGFDEIGNRLQAATALPFFAWFGTGKKRQGTGCRRSQLRGQFRAGSVAALHSAAQPFRGQPGPAGRGPQLHKAIEIRPCRLRARACSGTVSAGVSRTPIRNTGTPSPMSTGSM